MNSLPPEGYWLIDDRPYHPGCAPWASSPFPYAWAVDEARRVLSALRGAGRPMPDAFARALRWLEDAAERWPGARPAEVVRAAAKAVAIVEQTRRSLEAARSR